MVFRIFKKYYILWFGDFLRCSKKEVEKHLPYRQAFDGSKKSAIKINGWGIFEVNHKFLVKEALNSCFFGGAPFDFVPKDGLDEIIPKPPEKSDLGLSESSRDLTIANGSILEI